MRSLGYGLPTKERWVPGAKLKRLARRSMSHWRLADTRSGGWLGGIRAGPACCARTHGPSCARWMFGLGESPQQRAD